MGIADSATEYSALPREAGPCGNEGWCMKCSTLYLKENQGILKSVDEILLDNFKYIQAITCIIEAPKDCPYEGNTFQIDIEIPDKYPKEPLRCYLKQ